MPCRWKNEADVDEAAVVVMNVPDKKPEPPNWLLVTLNAPVADSDKKWARSSEKRSAGTLI